MNDKLITTALDIIEAEEFAINVGTHNEFYLKDMVHTKDEDRHQICEECFNTLEEILNEFEIIGLNQEYFYDTEHEQLQRGENLTNLISNGCHLLRNTDLLKDVTVEEYYKYRCRAINDETKVLYKIDKDDMCYYALATPKEISNIYILTLNDGVIFRDNMKIIPIYSYSSKGVYKNRFVLRDDFTTYGIYDTFSQCVFSNMGLIIDGYTFLGKYDKFGNMMILAKGYDIKPFIKRCIDNGFNEEVEK